MTCRQNQAEPVPMGPPQVACQVSFNHVLLGPSERVEEGLLGTQSDRSLSPTPSQVTAGMGPAQRLDAIEAATVRKALSVLSPCSLGE